jgi:addiction module HigA family antidote
VQLARDIGVAPSRISMIINRRRAITAETALRLAAYLGGSAKTWMDLQTAYELEAAERIVGRRIRRKVKQLAA